MQRISIQLAKFPLRLNCFDNGCISIEPIAIFPSIVDQPNSITEAVIDAEGITIGDTIINYGDIIEYKHKPALLKWLQSLNLEMPNIQRGF